MSLAVCSSAAWIAVLVLYGLAGFLSNPLSLFFGGGGTSTVDGQVLALTFGLPSIFSEDLSCISFLLLPPGLFALSLLPLLSRRGYGSGTFWITLMSVGYSAF